MSTTVTIGAVRYTIEKLETGNIRVTYAGGQLHPMQGADTDDIHLFEVHPVQSRWYAYWNALLDPKAKDQSPSKMAFR